MAHEETTEQHHFCTCTAHTSNTSVPILLCLKNIIFNRELSTSDRLAV